MFELELSWVGKGKSTKSKETISNLILNLVNDGKHERVPTKVFEDAEKFAKVRQNSRA